MMARMLIILALVANTGLTGCRLLASDDRLEHGRPAVSMRDFFHYACVQEYIRTHSFTEFDNSVAYGVEYSQVSDDVLSRVYAAAKAFAATLRAPDLTDEEHGGVAVLALCLEKSRDPVLAPVVMVP